MLNFCLPRDRVEAFVKALQSGELKPEDLANMTSKERRETIGKYVGEGAAKAVNAEFESKLLLKNQNQGMATWIKSVAGLRPEIRRDILSRVSKMDNVLEPADKEAFLADLVSRKLEADVTPEEAQHIADLSHNVQELEEKTSYANENLSNVSDLAKYDYKPTEDDIAYGKALMDFRNYVGDLKNDTTKFRLSDFKGKGIVKVPFVAARAVFDISKSIGASLDDSFFGRQGNSIAITHPVKWIKQFVRSFGDIGKSIVEKKNAHSVDEATHATLMADPMYRQALKDGVPLTGSRDVFATSLPEKLPILGRFFKASEATYGAAHDLLLFSIYKQQMKRAAELGVDLSEKNASKNIGNLTASMAGAGNLGSLEKLGGVLNLAFYSLRFLKSNLDQLALHPLGFGVGGTGDFALSHMTGKEGTHITSYAQKEAAKNLLKVVTVLAGVLATANTLVPGSADLTPNSTDLGKIKIGDTRFDITGGKAALIVLAAKIISGSSVSSTSGTVTKLNAKDKNGNPAFGAETTMDVINSFFEGKLSPVGGVIRDVLKGSTFSGKPITLGGEVGSLGTPLGITNLMELASDPHAANIFAAYIADSLGYSTNTIPNSNIKSGIIPTGQNFSTDNMVKAIALYAQAIGTDPETAFNRIFTGQQIKQVTNGTVIVQRMSLADSTAVKKAGKGNNPTMKLDHTIPLELGGSNDTSNLKLVTTAQWASYTPVEDALGNALKAGKISKDDAQNLIQDFKNGKTSAKDILAKYK